jgi:glycerophosphoryl diester phosphodiesterase
VTRIFGHRGASAHARENTIEAFTLARSQGADGVELDVRMTADGVLVVHHDPELEGAGPLHLLERSQLPSWLPTLDDVLDAFATYALNVEIKSLPGEPAHDPAEPLAAAVADRLVGWAGDLVVSSFNEAALDRVREVGPGVPTAQLTLPVWDQTEWVERAARRGCVAINPHHLSVNAELCAAAHDRGLAVHTWTVDDPERMVWLAGCGVDAVITNLPDVAIAALRGRRE